jgi:hypothetical protein
VALHVQEVESFDLADGIADGDGFDIDELGPALEEGVVVGVAVPVHRCKRIPEADVDSG